MKREKRERERERERESTCADVSAPKKKNEAAMVLAAEQGTVREVIPVEVRAFSLRVAECAFARQQFRSHRRPQICQSNRSTHKGTLQAVAEGLQCAGRSKRQGANGRAARSEQPREGGKEQGASSQERGAKSKERGG